jgi:CRP/FNR family transcriptional regulator, polysaccharide utilization system transcription regulator
MTDFRHGAIIPVGHEIFVTFDFRKTTRDLIKTTQGYPCETCPAGKLTLFASFDKADLQYINNQKIVTFYKKGEDIFHEGNKATGLYCLVEGIVKVYRQGIDGREHIVRFALPGEFVGLKALITGNGHTSSAAAFEDSVVCYIGKYDFFQLMIKYPEFARSLIFSLSQILEEAEKKMTSLAQRPVRERLAETLVFLNRSFNTKVTDPAKAYLNLTRTDLANIIGTAPETVIRLLSEFKDEKLIALKGRKLFVRNPDGLRKIARLSE